jgi:hypothetical protein
MDTHQDVETLKITFEDDTEASLPLWFTNQFDYFKNIIDDLGEEMYDDDGKEYKHFEMDFRGGMGSELGYLLTKPVLAFLKRFTYHIKFLKEGDIDDLDEDFDDINDPIEDNDPINESDKKKHSDWNGPDGFQTKSIMKYINNEKWDELFQIYAVTDYLGNSKICHAITDTIIKYFNDNGLINVEKIQDKFGLKSQFTKAQQKEILAKFDWRE